MKIKIIEYNILNGFCDDNPPFKVDTARMNNAINIIKKQNPDILILTEAYFWPFAKRVNLANLHSVFKNLYDKYASLAHWQFRYAPIILSKYPIEKFDISMSEYQLNYMRSNIQIGK